MLYNIIIFCFIFLCFDFSIILLQVQSCGLELQKTFGDIFLCEFIVFYSSGYAHVFHVNVQAWKTRESVSESMIIFYH